MPLHTLTYCTMSLRCLTLGSGVLSGSKITPPLKAVNGLKTKETARGSPQTRRHVQCPATGRRRAFLARVVCFPMNGQKDFNKHFFINLILIINSNET